MSEANASPPLVIVPASAVTINEPAPTILNAFDEGVVDVLLGTDAAVNLIALLRPGLKVGQELVVRHIRRAPHVVDGIEVSNKATLFLKVLTPGSLLADPNYVGFDGASQFIFPSYASNPSMISPAIAFFRWSGIGWLPTFKHLP
jgi:hypothetical protein